MTKEELLKHYILSKYTSIKEFANAIELPYGTVDGVIRRGILNSGTDNVAKVCSALGISIDALLQGRIEEVSSGDKTDLSQVEADPSVILKYFQTYNGKKINSSEFTILLDGMKTALHSIDTKRDTERLKEQLSAYAKLFSALSEKGND